MIGKIVFCFAFALQIFAWVQAGASIGFRSRRHSAVKSSANTAKKAPYNTVLFRRICLAAGAVTVAGYAVLSRDYVLLAGQAALFAVLWFRVAVNR